MKTLLAMRRSCAILCIAGLFLLTLTLVGAGHVFLLPLPLVVLFAALVSVLVCCVADFFGPESLSVIPVFSPRPPPAR
jgi:hypothetical protein